MQRNAAGVDLLRAYWFRNASKAPACDCEYAANRLLPFFSRYWTTPRSLQFMPHIPIEELETGARG
jgi:hypothetical protein